MKADWPCCTACLNSPLLAPSFLSPSLASQALQPPSIVLDSTISTLSGMIHSATAGSATPFLSLGVSSFLSSSATTCPSSIGSTAIMLLSPASLNATSLVRVVMRIESIWLVGRYLNSGCVALARTSRLAVRASTGKQASLALLRMTTHFSFYSSRSQSWTSLDTSASGPSQKRRRVERNA